MSTQCRSRPAWLITAACRTVCGFGCPHSSSLAAVIDCVQDIVTRYACATGHHCTRRFGWDCHGLPVEYEIDKKLGEAAKGRGEGRGGSPDWEGGS
jgi:hypothetical protein